MNHHGLAASSSRSAAPDERELPSPAISRVDFGLGSIALTRMSILRKELIQFEPGKENFGVEILGFPIRFGGFNSLKFLMISEAVFVLIALILD